MQPDCVCCKIVAGQIPAAKVYEDADAVAFMDIGPVAKGHTLVIPRLHADPLADTPPDVLQKLIVVVQKIVRAQSRALGCDGINVTQANGRAAGQVIPHVHFHVIPRFARDGCAANWMPGKYESPEEMNRYAERIRAALTL
jgi:histidine triad (HIT) family protein